MSGRKILYALRTGPKTNGQLQELTEQDCGSVARDCHRLMKSGLIKRVDGGTGKGSIAIYERVYS